MYYVLKPKNLNLEQRITKFPPGFEFNFDYAYLIINYLISQNIYLINESVSGDKKLGEINQRFINLCSSEMQSFFREYNKHLNYLYSNFPNEGRVLWRKNYAEGSCFSFAVSPFHLRSELELYTITDKKLITKIRKSNKARSSKIPNYLTHFFNDGKLTINLNEAFEDNYKTFWALGEKKRYITNLINIVAIANGNYRFSRNFETDGRLHTTLTGLSRGMRKHLRYDGKKLAEIDISSSIPFFLYFIFRNINTINTHLSKIMTSTKSFYTPYILVKRSVVLDTKEIEQFGDSVLNGTFYKDFENDFWDVHLMKELGLKEDEYFTQAVYDVFGREFDGDVRDIEKALKLKILSMLNARPNKYKAEEAVFQAKYPTINNFIKKFKRQPYKVAKRKVEKHKKVSHLLLQTESYFMISLLAQKLLRKFKNRLPFFTLHDCVITTFDKVEELHTFMKEFFQKEMNMHPNLHSEVWE